jgi:hypothetical protein
VGTILHYRRVEDHINHPTLKDIKQATKDNLIDWSLTTKWFNFNAHNDTTNLEHSKDTKWKIRCSTLSLPTLDILQRNYPKLIDNNTLCLLCHVQMETNDHLWTCPNIQDTLRSCFINIGDALIELLRREADKHSLIINDSIKTFRWAYRNEDIHPTALLLLKSYITTDMVGIFRSHFNKIETINRFILPFLHEASTTFKNNIWKKRNAIWKTVRSDMGLTKASFKNYYKLNRKSNNNLSDSSSSSNLNTQRHVDIGYINPFNDFRNFKLQKDFLYILFSSSNFLHSGSFFKHLECNDFIKYSSPICNDNYFIYNV